MEYLPNELIILIINKVSDIQTLGRLNTTSKLFTLDKVDDKTFLRMFSGIKREKIWNIKYQKWTQFIGKNKLMPYAHYESLEYTENKERDIGKKEHIKFIVVNAIKKNDLDTMIFIIKYLPCCKLPFCEVNTIINKYINNKDKSSANLKKIYLLKLLRNKLLNNVCCKKIELYMRIPYVYLLYFIGTEEMTKFILNNMKHIHSCIFSFYCNCGHCEMSWGYGMARDFIKEADRILRWNTYNIFNSKLT